MSGKLKEVRERIASVNNTQQITKAMKMVSAAKFRKAQTAIVQIRPYANKLDAILKNVLSGTENSGESQLSKSREVNKVLMVVVTSNKGLCGAFNTNINKLVKNDIDNEYNQLYESGNLKIVCIGKKSYDFLKNRYKKAVYNTSYIDIVSKLTFDKSALLADRIMEKFISGQYDKVIVYYAHFKNAATQFPVSYQFLPVQNNASDSTASEYIFEPSKEVLMEQLVPSILRTTLHKCILDTHASEHGARMTAMDKATENAGEMLKELTISYNKARQETITRELSEIVSGAAALG